MSADRIAEPARNTRPPSAQAALGVGVIVEDVRGRVLLGRHHSGTWELPGGKVDATHESIAAAGARELREETGLVVDEAAVDVIAMVHDVIGGINRVSMAAVVRLASGVPEVTEPHLISAWQWTPPRSCRPRCSTRRHRSSRPGGRSWASPTRPRMSCGSPRTRTAPDTPLLRSRTSPTPETYRRTGLQTYRPPDLPTYRCGQSGLTV